MRASLEGGESFATLLEQAGIRLATDRLIPFARWVTPTAESRRYDARFYLARAPEGQGGLHDEHETVSSVWSTPARMLGAFDAGDVFLAPPTTRCLELLKGAVDVDAALALASDQSLAPICPELLPSEDRIVLALPGDPAHSVKDRRVAGPTRFNGRRPPHQRRSVKGGRGRARAGTPEPSSLRLPAAPHAGSRRRRLARLGLGLW